MTSSAPLLCAVCSVKFEDLDSLLQHMATQHTATAAPAPAAAACQPTSARQIVLSRTAFLRLKPLLQQNASRNVVTIVTRGGGRGRRPIRPRPPAVAASPGASLDVEVLEPSEPAVRVVRQPRTFDPDNIECCVCRRNFKHKYSLVAHCRQHLMSRLCGVCHRRLPDGQALVDHLETHMEKNSTFKCDQCDKSFVHAKSLYVHKRNHSGVRPYACQYCHKTFRHWHKHRVHVRIHTGERPYRCDVCGWGFPRNDERKRHMRTHIGTKSFHCIDCGVGCGTQMALMRHQELHHGKSTPALPEEEGEASTEAVEEGEDEVTMSPTDAAGDGETEESFNDLDEQITVKVEMEDLPMDAMCNDSGDDGDTSDRADVGNGDGGTEAEDSDEDGGDADDPPYRPGSDSESDASGGSERRGAKPRSESRPDGPVAADAADLEEEEDGKGDGEVNPLPDPAEHQPQRDPIAIDEPTPVKSEESKQPAVVIKTEPKDTEEGEQEPANTEEDNSAAPWDCDSDSEFDAASAHLLEPEVNLTEMFIDIERMRSIIRRKIAANAHKFDDAVEQEARSFVRNPEPSIDNMRSILRAKLEEGKRIQALLSCHDTEKRPLQCEAESTHKKIKLEPLEAEEFSSVTTAPTTGVAAAPVSVKSDAPVQEETRTRVRRLAPAGDRRWLGGQWRGGAAGRTSDPTATPRVPRRRWIQHELNFTPEEGTLADVAAVDGVRISTGFGEL